MSLNNSQSFRANGTIGPSRFVMIDTTADGMVLQATANARPIGIAQSGMRRAPGISGSDNTQAAIAGDSVQLFGLGDVCLINSGAAFVRGDLLKSDANGNAVTATVVGTDECGAVALQSASGANVLVLAQVVSRKL